MALLFIFEWFDSAIAKAIGWTLIHSLWQGFLLAIATALIIIFTKKSKPDLRYSLFTAVFFIFILVASSTFIHEVRSTAIVTTDISPIAYSTEVFYNPSVTDFKQTDSSFSSRFTGYFNTYGYLIIAVWFIIFMIKSVQLAISFGQIQRIRRGDRSFSIPSWEKRLNELAALLNIQRAVSLRESIVVKVPVAIGYLKPLILLPVGLVNNLPPDQVEAIILHELAHIRRKDYVVNLLQCITETIFFFNPAVLWLSSILREERENCCDDMAIAVLKKKSTFIHALMSFQEYSTGKPMVTPAFSGEKYPLLKRIQRIVYNNNKNLNNMEKIFLGTGLVVTGLVAFAFSSKTSDQYKKIDSVIMSTEVVSNIPANATYSHQIVNDTVPFEVTNKKTLNGTITSTIEEKEYKILVKDDHIIELYIDGKPITSDKIGSYKAVTNKMINDAREHNVLLKLQAEQYQKQAEMRNDQARVSQKRNDELAMLNKELAEKQAGKLKEQGLLRENQSQLMETKIKSLQEDQVKNQQKYEAEHLKKNDQQLSEKQLLDEKLFKQKNDELRMQEKVLLLKQAQLKQQQEKLMQENRKKEDEMNFEYKKSMEEFYKKKGDSLNSKINLFNKMQYETNNSYEPNQKLSYSSQQMVDYNAYDKFNYNAAQPLKYTTDNKMLYSKEAVYNPQQLKYFSPATEYQGFEYKPEGKVWQINITTDLKKEKVIKNDNNLSVTLSHNELIVNDVKQPASLHKKLKDKYLKNTDRNSVLSFTKNAGEIQ